MRGLDLAVEGPPEAESVSFEGLRPGETPVARVFYKSNADRELAFIRALEMGHGCQRDANDETALVWR